MVPCPTARVSSPVRTLFAGGTRNAAGGEARRIQNEPIYERAGVKRGGADFASRVPAHPLRRRLRSIWPISDRSADDSGVHPATHPLSPRPREIFLPSVAAVYEALTDVT